VTAPRLLDQVRATIRARQSRTEDAYVHWIRFIVFHGRRHPLELRAADITAFITWLAVDPIDTMSYARPDPFTIKGTGKKAGTVVLTEIIDL
jgi:hypothetical protein